MGFLQTPPAVVVIFGLLLLLACDVSVSGDPSSTPDGCSKDVVKVYQYKYHRPILPDGTPAYYVIVSNISNEATVSGIKISCGDFNKTKWHVDPNVFRPVGSHVCLVKNGGTMRPGDTVSFHYSNDVELPLDVHSIKCGGD